MHNQNKEYININMNLMEFPKTLRSISWGKPKILYFKVISKHMPHHLRFPIPHHGTLIDSNRF